MILEHLACLGWDQTPPGSPGSKAGGATLPFQGRDRASGAASRLRSIVAAKHPRLCGATANEDVEGRHKAGHDAQSQTRRASVVRHAAGELRADRLESVEDIEAARKFIRVDVVLAHDPHGDAVKHLARREVDPARHHQVGGRERERVLVKGERSAVRGRPAMSLFHETHRAAGRNVFAHQADELAKRGNEIAFALPIPSEIRIKPIVHEIMQKILCCPQQLSLFRCRKSAEFHIVQGHPVRVVVTIRPAVMKIPLNFWQQIGASLWGLALVEVQFVKRTKNDFELAARMGNPILVDRFE